MADTPRPSGPRRPTGSTPAQPSADPNDRQALLKAYQDVVQEQKDKHNGPPGPPPAAPSKAPFWILMLSLAAGLGATLVLQPEWLFPKVAPEPPALQEASLRVRMYVEIDHIEAFKAQEGRLPATLLEARGDTTGLTYAPGEGGYSLTGRNGSISLTYASSQAPREFLGDSYTLISHRSGK
ncbi:MAG: hypothetical protein U0104_11800 [Gemmatimonadales bacterium]